MAQIRVIALVGIAMAAVLFDLCNSRIPNALILVGLVLGVVYQLSFFGGGGMLRFLYGAGIPILIFGVLYVFRMIGAGDIKLLCFAGGFLGPLRIIRCIFWMLISAAVLSLIRVFADHSLAERLKCLWQYVRESLQSGIWSPYLERADERARIHLSVPILIGILFCL